MNYEIAVLAALVQLEHPTTPEISRRTGISTRRVQTAIENLKNHLQVTIDWNGPKKNGHYQIQSWGVFESGTAIRRQAMSMDLTAYSTHRKIGFDSLELKRQYLNQVKHSNYKHSLKLEGFTSSSSNHDLSNMDSSARKKLKADLKRRFTKDGATSLHDAG